MRGGGGGDTAPLPDTGMVARQGSLVPVWCPNGALIERLRIVAEGTGIAESSEIALDKGVGTDNTDTFQDMRQKCQQRCLW